MIRRVGLLGTFWSASVTAALSPATAAGGALDVRPYLGDDAVRADFSGSNVSLLYRYLLAASERARKGDFETTEEHQRRINDLPNSIAPIDPTQSFAFPLYGVTASYDADRQVWTVKTDFGDGCEELSSAGAIYACRSVRIRTDKPGYVGQNAYGSAAHVSVVEVLNLRFAISEDWLRSSGLFKQTTGIHYDLSMAVPMPIERARQFRAHPLKVYAVGHVISPLVDSGSPIYDRPTISDPVSMKTRNVTLGLLPTRLIVVAEGVSGVIESVNLTGG